MAGAGSDVTRVAVTGADGFIGRALVAHLAREGFDVRAITRHSHGDLAAGNSRSLSDALRGLHAVVHLAARAHVMHEREPDPAAAFHAANVVATQCVARAARDGGVRRFVLASTAKVNGEATLPGKPFRVHDVPVPRDAYARSKRDAELALRAIAGDSSMSAVVLRLPLVYGPGVRGNFRTLWDAVAQRQWLPIAAIDNRRSLLGLDNAVSALSTAIDTPPGTYFVADDPAISTPQLVVAMAAALQVEPRLARVPVALLAAIGLLSGRREAIARLTGSLEIDSSAFREASGWRPVHTLAQGLAAILPT